MGLAEEAKLEEEEDTCLSESSLGHSVLSQNMSLHSDITTQRTQRSMPTARLSMSSSKITLPHRQRRSSRVGTSSQSPSSRKLVTRRSPSRRSSSIQRSASIQRSTSTNRSPSSSGRSPPTRRRMATRRERVLSTSSQRRLSMVSVSVESSAAGVNSGGESKALASTTNLPIPSEPSDRPGSSTPRSDP